MRREVPGGPSAKAGPGWWGGAAGRWRGPRGRWEWEETGAPWGEPDGCREEAEAAGETPRRGRGGEEGSAGRAEGAAPEAGVCRLHLEPCPVFEAMAWHLFPAGAGSPHLGLSGPREAAPGQSSRRGSDPQAAPVPSHGLRCGVGGLGEEGSGKVKRQGRESLPKKTAEVGRRRGPHFLGERAEVVGPMGSGFFSRAGVK